MKEEEFYEDDTAETISGWIFFFLSGFMLYVGLETDFFPLWFPPACYFAILGLSLWSELTDDHDDTSATSESAIKKQSQP